MDTLNTSTAKIPHYRGVATYVSDVPTTTFTPPAFPDFLLYKSLSALNIPPQKVCQLHSPVRYSSSRYCIAKDEQRLINAVVAALEILRHCLCLCQ